VRIRALALKSAAAATAAAAAFGAMPAAAAQAVPIQGVTPWSVLLCKYKDQPQEPKTPQFFREFLTDAGNGLGGVSDYFDSQTAGRVDLGGSVVKGWYTLAYTLEQEKTRSRWQKTQDCVDAAKAAGYTVPSGHRITVALNANLDGGAAGGRVLLDPNSYNVGFAAHEMLHGYGLGHSFSDDPEYRNASWSAIGEYDDPWDIMSAMNIYGFATTRFGTSAIGLNGYFLDKIGWLGRSRILTLGADGVASRTVTLAPLEVPGASGPQLIRIPFDPNDLTRYYTVEFRKKTAWSQAIPADIVRIHEIKNGTPYLLRTRGGSRSPVQSLNANGVTISVGSISGNSATVTVSSQITDRCLTGWVWREARPSDHVCVTGTVRSETKADNDVKESRWVDGPYGPHTCIQGYVWREAFAGDDVCVIPSRRTQAANDNAAANSRRNAARFFYGPNSCKAGYVWREADDSDYVCVSGTVRAETRADNDVKASRWTPGPYGPHTCIQGYVWREAYVGDDVCVVPARRTQAANDNAAAASRVLNP
jgi:hypothetical protein